MFWRRLNWLGTSLVRRPNSSPLGHFTWAYIPKRLAGGSFSGMFENFGAPVEGIFVAGVDVTTPVTMIVDLLAGTFVLKWRNTLTSMIWLWSFIRKNSFAKYLNSPTKGNVSVFLCIFWLISLLMKFLQDFIFTMGISYTWNPRIQPIRNFLVLLWGSKRVSYLGTAKFQLKPEKYWRSCHCKLLLIFWG